MTSTKELIESYLFNMGRDFTSPSEGVWIIHDEYDHVENIVVVSSEPVVTLRVKLMELPKSTEKRAELYDMLLRLNATEMVAGAYGIEEDAIVVVDTLQSENLDQNELEAAVDGISMAISLHYQKLNEFREHESSVEQDAAMKAFDEKLDGPAAEA